ncbi:PfkB family carbohydrate kinase [Roseomonas sp. CCTCC AB2023176]|uniref:PfkB family carbohydrate kinase n=1 Tax=Roseomonas sp. CCTCC AB2023176 TaxID=3342640 RepID=UPI0035DAF0BC
MRGTVTVFGSINADLVFPVPSLPAPGHTVLGGAWSALPGGKGANQAVAAARDGAAVRMFGAVGQDALAEAALSALRGSGADLSGVVRTDVPTGAAAICVDAEGRNQIAVSPGANARARADAVPVDALDGVVLLQMEVPPAENATLVARVRAHGGRAILNMAPAGPLAAEALRGLHLLVVNEHEAAWIGAHLGCDGAPAALRAVLGVAIAVTRGEAGAEAADGDGLHAVPAFRAGPVQDTTGAGDCWCGVLAAGLSRGMPLVGAMRRAAAAAALSVTRRGAAAAMPDATETDALLAGAG